MRQPRAGLLLALCLATAYCQAQPVHADGFEESCAVDTDQDRLSNCAEVAANLDYHDPDTDDDGLSDGDEVLPTPDGLNLAAFGVDPRHKDLLVEYDWQDDNVEPQICGPHTHKPSAETMAALKIAFAAMPVPNPDGKTGINLIQDAGQGGIFTGGNHVDVAGGMIQGNLGPDFESYRSANFSTNRIGYFRYALNTHSYGSNPDSSGFGELIGDELAVTVGCSWNQDWIRNTLMHELGHNLGLHHGGNTACDWKPNYNSIMNHRFQESGIDTDCKIGGDGVMDYSAGSRAPLDENHLNEPAGLCGGIAIDWNATDGGLLGDTSHDVNAYAGIANPETNQIKECGALLTTLTDHDDFAALNFTGLPGAPGGGAPNEPAVVLCAGIPEE